jgi:S-DNA-T family DNA segregation ATPase FtsK/SpoIIIE
VDQRRGLIHFKHRVATQMSEDASHTFVRSRDAARLQLEGPTPVNALYFNVDADSSVRFKPYSTKSQPGMPSFVEQLHEIATHLFPRRII